MNKAIKSNRLLLLIKIVLTVSAILAVALPLAQIMLSARTVMISGKVVSANTHQPVSGTLVTVESVLPYPWETSGLGQYVKTDSGGKFSAEVRGEVSLRAWKSGYAMASESAGSSSELSGKEIAIEIRELASGVPVQENILREGIVIGDGFCFRLGKIVSGDSPEADFRLIKEIKSGRVMAESLGEGGLFYQEYGKEIDFYNTPEAPLSGYSKQLPVTINLMGVFYAVTKDGKHYAKVRLIPGGLKQTSQGTDYSAYWPQWAYQPDGTRILEIAVCKEYLFPFEKFGLRRETLK